MLVHPEIADWEGLLNTLKPKAGDLTSLKKWCHDNISSSIELNSLDDIKIVFNSYLKLNNKQSLGTLFDSKSLTQLTVSHEAAKLDYDQFLDQCLQQYDDDQKIKFLNQGTKIGHTALHIASFFGNTNTIKVLLKHDAQPNRPAQNSLLPIHLAASKNSVAVDKKIACVKELLAETYSANLLNTSKKDHGSLLLSLIELTDNSEFIDTVIQQNKALLQLTDTQGQNPLHAAIILNRSTLVTYFLTYNFLTEGLTHNKSNLLHLACSYGNVDLIIQLLNTPKFHKFLEMKNNAGYTPVECLLKRENISVENLDTINKQISIPIEVLSTHHPKL